MVPAQASSYLDLRTVPGIGHEEIADRVQSKVRGRIRIHSSRLLPRECPSGAQIVHAARRARPASRLYGSRTMSDLVFFTDVPAIKCGPGLSERSHTPDEFVMESEVLEGARFYLDLVQHFAEIAAPQRGRSS
jgi:acetylornithine deacetylase